MVKGGIVCGILTLWQNLQQIVCGIFAKCLPQFRLNPLTIYSRNISGDLREGEPMHAQILPTFQCNSAKTLRQI